MDWLSSILAKVFVCVFIDLFIVMICCIVVVQVVDDNTFMFEDCSFMCWYFDATYFGVVAKKQFFAFAGCDLGLLSGHNNCRLQ